jgi:hypothetical protein
VIALLILVHLSLPVLAQAPQISPDLTSRMAIIGGNSLIGMVSPYFMKGQVLGTIIDTPEVKLIYETLIGKLCYCESGNKPEIINPNDKGSPSYSILQFKAPTFHNFCVVKYGLPDEIMNPDIQRKCADLMLQEDFDNIWNWSNCYNKIK